MKHRITDFHSLKDYLRNIENPIFSVGSRAFNIPFGAYQLFQHFHILSCRNASLETNLLGEKIPITYLDKHIAIKTRENYLTYGPKKPVALLQDKRITDYLDSFRKKPVLLFFKMYPEIEEICLQKNYIAVGSPFSTFQKYEQDKIAFQLLLDNLNISSPKHTAQQISLLQYEKIKQEIGEKFVIQLPNSELGAGTFFIFNVATFHKILQQTPIQEAASKNIPVRITRYVEMTDSPSMTVCVTKHGIFHSKLQRQLLDIREVTDPERRSGSYCGHDWAASSFPNSVERQAHDIVTKIGQHLHKNDGFRGIFGIDFVLEKATDILYPTEINVRLLGSFPVFSMIQHAVQQPLLQGLQILDSLDSDNYDLDVESLHQNIGYVRQGSQLNVYAKNKNISYTNGSVLPGIYSVDEHTQAVRYNRPGVVYEDIQSNNEFLVTGPLPYPGQVYKNHDFICKIISKESISQEMNRINPTTAMLVQYIYESLLFKEV